MFSSLFYKGRLFHTLSEQQSNKDWLVAILINLVIMINIFLLNAVIIVLATEVNTDISYLLTGSTMTISARVIIKEINKIVLSATTSLAFWNAYILQGVLSWYIDIVGDGGVSSELVMFGADNCYYKEV